MPDGNGVDLCRICGKPTRDHQVARPCPEGPPHHLGVFTTRKWKADRSYYREGLNPPLRDVGIRRAKFVA